MLEKLEQERLKIIRAIEKCNEQIKKSSRRHDKIVQWEELHKLKLEAKLDEIDKEIERIYNVRS